MSKTNDNEIILRVEHVITGTTGQPGAPGTTATTLPSQQNAARKQSPFTGGISAQLFVSGFTQVLGAAGNQQVAGVIRQGAEYGFLIARAAALDITAMATIAFKISALALQKWNEYKQEQREIAKSYNDLTLLLMQTGQVSINANTVTSYDKWGKLTLTDRK